MHFAQKIGIAVGIAASVVTLLLARDKETASVIIGLAVFLAIVAILLVSVIDQSIRNRMFEKQEKGIIFSYLSNYSEWATGKSIQFFSYFCISASVFMIVVSVFFVGGVSKVAYITGFSFSLFVSWLFQRAIVKSHYSEMERLQSKYRAASEIKENAERQAREVVERERAEVAKRQAEAAKRQAEAARKEKEQREKAAFDEAMKRTGRF